MGVVVKLNQCKFSMYNVPIRLITEIIGSLNADKEINIKLLR